MDNGIGVDPIPELPAQQFPEGRTGDFIDLMNRSRPLEGMHALAIKPRNLLRSHRRVRNEMEHMPQPLIRYRNQRRVRSRNDLESRLAVPSLGRLSKWQQTGGRLLPATIPSNSRAARALPHPW